MSDNFSSTEWYEYYLVHENDKVNVYRRKSSNIFDDIEQPIIQTTVMKEWLNSLSSIDNVDGLYQDIQKIHELLRDERNRNRHPNWRYERYSGQDGWQPCNWGPSHIGMKVDVFVTKQEMFDYIAKNSVNIEINKNNF